MKNSTKFIVIGTLLGTLGLAGMARFAFAGPAQPPYATIPEQHDNKLTAQVGNGNKVTNDGVKEAAADQRESGKLQALAKVTPQQAQQAAESAQGGQAKNVKLENENGNLVYTVDIGNKEVTVDAGNGKVLFTETANQENKANEANHPRSSIQVSEAPGGDGDGETNDDG
ncbi:PepSY domain-containing protein [Synechococcus sp. PCC 6312]|uniref:PepSY domain-containing protein n=1 Tax=Synechococcus sp. (strain ATCC 27167 / PCC 6312) TaxID=195253 RepID=UPI00029F1B66|nr:PepSY domain-containing protein [Synechococcus sp. PCC 6312]AFY61902.1 Peptidase propeptide domain-containing protein [Synechococcus sp. PCC 6312]